MRAYDVGLGKFYGKAQLARFGTPQGPTELVIMKPFSRPIIEAGTYQQRRESPRAISEHGPPQEQPHPSQTDKKARSFPVQRKDVLRRFSHSPLSKGTWMSVSTCLSSLKSLRTRSSGNG